MLPPLVAAISVTDSKTLKATYQATLDTIFEKLESVKALDGTYAANITTAQWWTMPIGPATPMRRPPL